MTEQGNHVLATVREACQRMRVGRTLFNELMRSGQIRTIRVGKRGIRVPLAEIDRYVDERLTGQ
jgi:excisionase family DNA binding protein